jgi:hypothetical protein
VEDIYHEGFACRICCRLNYEPVSASVRAGCTQNWQRQIGADPHAFADLPKCKRITCVFTVSLRIRVEEGKLL